MAKRKGRGRPKVSRVKKKVKESVDNEFVIPDNTLDVLETKPDVREDQEGGNIMPKQKRRGRPKKSQAQNFQRSVHCDLSRCINPSNMVEVGAAYEESEEAVVPKKNKRGRPRGSRGRCCQENADSKNIYSNPSNMMEAIPGCKENHETVTTDAVNKPRTRGLQQPVESMNQENHQQNPEDIIVKPKRVRAQRKELTLEMKRLKSADGKLDVLIHPTKLVAVGPGRNDFIADLSLIVRRNARLNVSQWKKVPQSTRDIIVENILNNWRLQDTDMMRKAILHEAGRLYHNWRSKLRDYYSKFETKDEALKHVPDDVNASDWQFLVDYFSSSSFETMSAKNKANRRKQQTKHTTGSKSFVAVSYDARDPVTGMEPNLHTFWQLTHKRANGEWIDEASKEVNDKVAEQINEKICEIEDYPEVVETNEEEIINTAFRTVTGRKSYFQGFEARERSSSSRSSIIQQLQAELDAQKRQTENARKECNEIRARLVEVESHLKEEQLKRKEVEARMFDSQNVMEEINSQVQNTIQAALSPYLPLKTEAETSSRRESLKSLKHNGRGCDNR